MDLFIDVPINIRDSAEPNKHFRREAFLVSAIIRGTRGQFDPGQDHKIGAASFILNSYSQQNFTRLVIEGAPGQGKSTISQYVCQMHRSRILQENLEDDRIPVHHRDNPVRLPFKIDCRDFSLWLSRINPFSSDEKADVPDDWQKSLEAFLAAQIHHYSGGASFNVSDLHAVLKLSAVLIVFDGLDEVADVSRRREVIDQIIKGTNRLHDLAVSAQTIVTSRPAAFANSPGLPQDTFRHFHLSSIDRPLIDDYARKWLRARRLDGKEASDVHRILRDKLDQPHIRELARNPMQLAILLSLVQTRGGSLPDKRTALYDNYVQLFFNRESEKSSIVRDHRDLLIDIHQYLGWVLHAESQTKRNRGSVSSEKLQVLVKDYLAHEGHDPSLADRLFTGMVERVVALVSRVEGTYEFEVQPLREYFAARHLYCTAPYSPAGSEQRGTLPDRFDALCRDFYWLNVTRFYAGCYNKGELPSLVDRLEDLSRAEGYKYTSHPQMLAATLLSDWVFAQHPKAMKQVVGMVLDGIGLRYITSGGPAYRREEPLVLPRNSGNEELVERAFALLAEKPAFDFAWMLIELIRENTTPETATQQWVQVVRSKTGEDKTSWIRYGMQLGVLSKLPREDLEQLLTDKHDYAQRLRIYMRAGQSKFIEADEERLSFLVDHLLDAPVGLPLRRIRSLIESFAEALAPHRYALAFENRHPTPLSDVWEQLGMLLERPAVEAIEKDLPSFRIANQIQEIVDMALGLSKDLASDWATGLSSWSQLVERARQLFGDRWSIMLLANASAGIRSKEEQCDDAADFFDESIPLCRRVRYARLRAGSSSWWNIQLSSATTQFEIACSLLVFFSWSGASVFEKLAFLADDKIRSLELDWWKKISDAIRSAPYGLGVARREIKVALKNLPSELSERTIIALSFRLNEESAQSLFLERLSDYNGDDPAVLAFCQQSALRAAQHDPDKWRSWLPVVSDSYAKGVVSDLYIGYRFSRIVQTQTLPDEIAREIVARCSRYPADLVAWAEACCRERVATQVVPVGTVAVNDKWF